MTSLHIASYFHDPLANSDWIKLSSGEKVIAYPSYNEKFLKSRDRGYDHYLQRELYYFRCAPTTIQKIINYAIYAFNQFLFFSIPYLSTKEKITFVFFSYQVPYETRSRPIFSHVKERTSKAVTIYKNTF